MSAQRSKSTLAAKAVQMVYEFPGDLKRGWEAERTGDSSFLLRRPDGTTREINLYEPLRTAKGDILPMQNTPLGLLTVGDWSVLIGKGINHNLHARKRGADNTYILFEENNTKNLGEYKIGQMHNGRPVAQIDNHLLQIGDDIVAIKPRKHDITLLVMNTEHGGGNLAYINMVELGNSQNRKDGARGTFMRPKRPGEPALFVEEFAGKQVITAQFWLDKNDKRITWHYRNAEVALHTTELNRKLEEAREAAFNVGIDPEDYETYVKLEEKQKKMGDGWTKDSMGAINGLDMFRPKSRDSEPPTP